MRIMNKDGMTDVPATIICDGLAVSGKKVLTTTRGRQYVIFHIASGATVSTGRTKRLAQKIAAAIAPLADWTLPQSDLRDVEGLLRKVRDAEDKAAQEENDDG